MHVAKENLDGEGDSGGTMPEQAVFGKNWLFETIQSSFMRIDSDDYPGLDKPTENQRQQIIEEISTFLQAEN